MSVYLIFYLACVALDGDYLNDYLTELPYGAQLVGMALAIALGYGI